MIPQFIYVVLLAGMGISNVAAHEDMPNTAPPAYDDASGRSSDSIVPIDLFNEQKESKEPLYDRGKGENFEPEDSPNKFRKILASLTEGIEYHVKYIPSLEYHDTDHKSTYFLANSLNTNNKFFIFRNDLELRVQQRNMLAQVTLRTQSRKDINLYTSYINQLYYEKNIGKLNLTLGKKVISWGVGHAFRPLDVIQQEDRVMINAPALIGVPLFSFDKFFDSGALSLVWANPLKKEYKINQYKNNHDESVALRYFGFSDKYDFHAVTKFSKNKKTEAGLGGTYILNDNLSLFGSALYSRRYSKTINSLIETNGVYSDSNPMLDLYFYNSLRADIGFQWTGDSGLGLMFEVFHDGQAYTKNEWEVLNDLTHKQINLSNLVSHQILVSNVAWSTAAFQNENLVRDNCLIRFSYDDSDGFKPYLDLLYASDGGLMTTVSVAYEKSSLRYSLGLRHYGGREGSAFYNVPESNITWGRLELTF